MSFTKKFHRVQTPEGHHVFACEQILQPPRATDKTVLLIHGLGCNHRDFDEVLRHVAEWPVSDHPLRRIIAIDLSGFGASDMPLDGKISVEHWAQDAKAVLVHLGIDQCEVVGMSAGGLAAVRLALDSPELVARLHLWNTQPCFKMDTLLKWGWAIQRRLLALLVGTHALARYTNARLVMEPFHQEMRLAALVDGGLPTRRAYRQGIKAVAGWSAADEIANLRPPIQVVSGSHDITTLHEKLQRLAGATVEKSVEINGNHVFHWNNAAAVAQALRCSF